MVIFCEVRLPEAIPDSIFLLVVYIPTIYIIYIDYITTYIYI